MSQNLDLAPSISTGRHLPVAVTASRSREKDDSCLLGTPWT